MIPILLKLFLDHIFLKGQLIPELPSIKTSGYTIKGESIIYNSRENKISLVKNCYFENANYTAKASKITYWIEENKLLMENAIIKSKDSRVLIKAGRIEFFGKSNTIKASGKPAIYSPEHRVKIEGKFLIYDMNKEVGELWRGIKVISLKDRSILEGYSITYSKRKETIDIFSRKNSLLRGIWKGDEILARHIKIEMASGTVILTGKVRATIHFGGAIPGKL